MLDPERIRASLPAHYDQCPTVAAPFADCDCTATADIETILTQLDQAARLVLSVVDPDGTY